MLAMGPRDLNSAPYSPVHCSSHSMTSFQSSELTELPVVENSQLFAQRAHSARYAPSVTISHHPTPIRVTVLDSQGNAYFCTTDLCRAPAGGGLLSAVSGAMRVVTKRLGGTGGVPTPPLLSQNTPRQLSTGRQVTHRRLAVGRLRSGGWGVNRRRRSRTFVTDKKKAQTL